VTNRDRLQPGRDRDLSSVRGLADDTQRAKNMSRHHRDRLDVRLGRVSISARGSRAVVGAIIVLCLAVLMSAIGRL
jgi:hypothetical protein